MRKEQIGWDMKTGENNESWDDEKRRDRKTWNATKPQKTRWWENGGKKEELRPERRAVTKRDKIKTQEKQLDEKIRDEKWKQEKTSWDEWETRWESLDLKRWNEKRHNIRAEYHKTLRKDKKKSHEMRPEDHKDEITVYETGKDEQRKVEDMRKAKRWKKKR